MTVRMPRSNRLRIARRRLFEQLEGRNLLATLTGTGVGQYRLALNDQGTEDPADDVAELFKSPSVTPLASALFSTLTDVSVTGATNSSDSLQVDFSGGNPIPAGGVSFNGLNGTGSDTLSFTGGAHSLTTYAYTNAKDGIVTLDGLSVSFLGLEPITNTGTTADVVFQLPTTADNVTLSELAGGELRLAGATIETTTIAKPTNSISVIGSTNDTINVGGTITLNLGTANLDLEARTVNINRSITTSGDIVTSGSDTFDLATSMSLTAGGVVSLNHTGSIELRGPVDAAEISLTSGSASSNAIWGVTATANLTASAGGISVTSTNGGIDFGASTISAIGIVQLAAGATPGPTTSVTVKTVSSDTGIHSTGGGTFDLLASGGISSAAAVVIDHGGSLELRSPVTGATVNLKSNSVSSNAIWGVTAAANVSSTAGDIQMQSTLGGIDFGVSTLQSSQDISLTAGSSVSVKTVAAGGSFTSTGGDQFDSTAGSNIDVDGSVTVNHTGTIELRGPIAAAAVSLTSASASSNAIWDATVASSITAESGNIALQSTSGGIDFGLSALVANANIQLTSAISANVKGVSTGGTFTSISSGTFDGTTGSVIASTGAVTIQHGGTVELRGLVTGSAVAITSNSVSSNAIYAVNAGTTLKATGGDVTLTAPNGGLEIGVSGIEASGNISLSSSIAANVKTVTAGGTFSSIGSGTFDAMTGAVIAAAGAVTVNHGGTVILRGPIDGSSISLTSGSTSSSAIWTTAATSDLNSTGGSIALAAPAGGINLVGDATVQGGDFSASGAKSFNLTAGRIIDTNGGEAAFDHDGVVTISGALQTDGGALDISMKLLTANPGTLLFVVTNGDVTFAPGSQLHVDVSAIDITSTPPLKFFNVLRATNGDVLGLANLTISSGLDLDGNTTAFTKAVITAGTSELLQIKGIETAPIIASGAGNYRLVLNPYGAGAEDDVIELYRNAVLINSRNYISTTFVQVTGLANSADSLQVDYSGGNPIPVGNVSFDGLAGALNDSLSITDGSHTTTTYNYTSAESGNINIDGGAISYTEVEQPVNTTSATVNAVFNLPVGTTTATLAELAGGGAELSATAITRTTIVDPSGVLVVNGDGNDTIIVGGANNLVLSTASLLLSANNVRFTKGATATEIDIQATNTVSNAVDVTVASVLSATNGDITVASAGGIDFSIATLSAAAGDIDLTSAGAVVLAGVSASGSFTSQGTQTFEKLASGSLTAGGSVLIDHGTTITVRGAISGATVDVSSDATTSTAIQLVAGTSPGFTATGGGLTLTSAGGLSLAVGALSATGGDIVLSAVGTVLLGNATVSGGDFESTSVGSLDLTSGKSLVASGSVTIDHLTAIFRGPVTGSTISVDTNSTVIDSLWTNVAAGVLTATAGNIELTAAQGGIDFAASTLSAAFGDVILAGQKAIRVNSVLAAGEFSSTSAGEFDTASSGSSITAGGAISIDHGTITIREAVVGASIEFQSSSSVLLSMQSVGVAATLTANTGDITLAASAGGINYATSNITATLGNVELTAVKAIDVRGVSAPAGTIESIGGGTWDMATGGSFLNAGGNITLDHVGAIIIRGPVTGDDVTMESNSATASAISAATTTPTITAAGDLALTAAAGGISFGAGNLVAGDSVTLTANENVIVRGVSAGGPITSTGGGSFDTASSGAVLTAGGDVHIDHSGAVLFRGPITGSSILLETTSGVAAAIHGVSAISTLTSTAGNVTLNATGGVMLNGDVEVNGGESEANAVNLTWGATSDLPNGVLGMSGMSGGMTRRFTNPGNAGFDVEVKFSGSFHGGYAGQDPALAPGNYIWFQSSNSTGGLAWFEFSFFQTGTNSPVDVLGLKTTFDDVERGGSTREWLLGPKVVSGGDVQHLDFQNTTYFNFPAGLWPAEFGTKTVDEVSVSRAVPGHNLASGTQAGKQVGVDISTIPLSYFRIGQQRNSSSAGSVLMAGLGNIKLASAVSSPGIFSSTGTVFTANGDIVVAGQGNIELHHSGTMNLYGTLDAGNYEFVDTNAALDIDVILRGTALLKLYVDVQSPPASPLVTMSGGGNLWFLSGSDIEILTTGTPTSAANGTYNLASVPDGGVVDNDGFNWLESGPGIDAVDSVFADGSFLKLLLDH